MNYYHLWVDLHETKQADEFCKAVDAYLGHLKSKGVVEGHKCTRRKLGFGPSELGEFHVIIEYRDLSQLEENFQAIIKADEHTARLHADVYSRVKNLRTALYRDYPDAI